MTFVLDLPRALTHARRRKANRRAARKTGRFARAPRRWDRPRWDRLAPLAANVAAWAAIIAIGLAVFRSCSS